MDERKPSGPAALGATGLSATAVIVIVVTILGGGPSTSSGPSAPPIQIRLDTMLRAAAVSTAPATPAPGTGARLLHDFFGASARADGQPCTAPGVSCYRLGVVVATLPDPNDSGLDWAFDAGWEAVRRGFERAGFVMDRFWFPWGAGADAALAESAPRTRRPGVVLFRHSDPRDSTLRLLYLVGEVPTAGIYKQAMATALAEADSLLHASSLTRADSAAMIARFRAEPCGVSCRGSLPIVGPTFSGSAVSLRAALRAFDATPSGRDATAARPATVAGTPATAGAPPPAGTPAAPDTVRAPDRAWLSYRIISGAASNEANECVLRWHDAGSTPATYSATVHVDSVLRRFQHEVLEQRLAVKPQHIAILREGTTQYGALSGATVPASGAGSAAVRDSASARGPPAPPSARDRVPSAGAGGTDSTAEAVDASGCAGRVPLGDPDRPTPLEIPFPINISRLRSVIDPGAQPQAGQPVFGREQPVLPLDLRETGRTITTPPVFSTLTPPAIAGVVDEIAGTLAAHRVHAVGIVASDVRDVVFLASEVRKRFRDVLLFTYSGNTLYAHPDYNVELRGMLVLSTYPLSLEAQYWEGPDAGRQRVAFTTNLAQGIYNATLRQLGVDAEVGLFSAAPLGDSAQAPVWATVVGRGALFPLALLELPAGSARGRYTNEEFPPDVDGPHPPLVWPAALFVLAACWLAWRAWRAWRHGGAREVRPPPGATRAMRSDWMRPWLAVQGAMFELARAGAVAVGMVLLGVVLYQWARGLLRISMTLVALAALVALAVVAYRASEGVAVFLAGWGRVRTRGAVPSARAPRVAPPPRPARRRSHRWQQPVEYAARSLLAVALVAVGTVAVLHLAYAVGGETLDVNRRVHMWRFAAIGSGVSPALPLALGALLVFGWAEWHRRRVGACTAVAEFERYCDRWWRVRLRADGEREPTRLVPVVGVGGDAARLRGEGADRVEPLLPVRELAAAMWKVRATLMLVVPDFAVASVLLASALLAGWMTARFGNTMEAVAFPGGGAWWRSFGLVYFLCIVGGLTATAIGLYRFVTVWLSLRDCLTALAVTRLLPAFRRLPLPVARLTRLNPRGAPRESVVGGALTLRWRAWEKASADAAAGGGPTAATPEATTATAPTPTPVPRLRFRCRSDPAGEATPVRLEPGLVRLLDDLELRWRTVPEDEPGAEGTAADAPSAGSAAAALRRAEECAAIFAVEYIEWVLQHLRLLAGFVLGASVLTTLLMASYPFQPQSAPKLVGLVLLLGTPAALLFVLYKSSRDEVLSNITRTDPGRLTWDGPFVVNVVVFVLVPVLTLLSTEVPEVRDFLFSWLTPLLRSAGRM